MRLGPVGGAFEFKILAELEAERCVPVLSLVLLIGGLLVLMMG
jgi:hypothetical protein